MFNWPLKLRHQTEFCTPKGPSFKFSGHVSFSVGGTKISFRAPRHSFASKLEPISHYNIYDMNDLRVRPWSSDHDEWLYQNFFRRQWRFYGPWFSGYKGNVTLDISLITRNKASDSASNYRPKVFESSILDHLKMEYSDDLFEGAQQWHAPVDWTVITAWPCVAATFYAMPNDDVPGCHSPCRYIVFPVSDKHLIRMSFELRRGAGRQYEQDKVIDIAPLEQLSSDIINSIQIKLSPEALAQQAKALEGIEDTGLSESFPPIKFTTPEQDAEHERYLQEEQRIQDILKGK
ncbi:MAG: hypothetical protein ACMZ64_01070 [Oleiphilus sp.]